MKRQFFLGDEWIYYKLYCGKRSADLILTEVIKPLTEELLKNGYIDQWFFIRFADPKPHLRLRFHMAELRHIGSIIAAVKDKLEPYLKNEVVWSMQTDTYKRELERYGTLTMADTEYTFFLDSQFCVDALSLIDDDRLTFLLSLSSIDQLLTHFQLDFNQKVEFTKHTFDAFKKEFQADKQLNKQLNLKYQTLKSDIHQFIIIQPNEYSPLFNLLKKKDDAVKTITKRINRNLQKGPINETDYLKHQVHMMVNRIFRDQQRLHELVCYSCLYRFYQSQKNKA